MLLPTMKVTRNKVFMAAVNQSNNRYMSPSTLVKYIWLIGIIHNNKFKLLLIYVKAKLNESTEWRAGGECSRLGTGLWFQLFH